MIAASAALPLLLVGVCLTGVSFLFLLWVWRSGRLDADPPEAAAPAPTAEDSPSAEHES